MPPKELLSRIVLVVCQQKMSLIWASASVVSKRDGQETVSLYEAFDEGRSLALLTTLVALSVRQQRNDRYGGG